MLLVNFKKWKNRDILLALVVITLLFAFFMPQTQRSKNMDLYNAVVENNVTKVKQWIEKGAEKNLLLPKGFPLISVAIEYENEAMVELLMLDTEDLIRDYKGYRIMDHMAKKNNKKILQLMVKALEQDKK